MMSFLELCVRADETMPLTNTTSSVSAAGDMAGRFGAGIIIGEPTGADLKFWLNDTMAVDGAVGWSTYDNSDLYLHSDVLWHKFDLITVPQGRLPVYFGVGGLVRFRNNHQSNDVGVRAPIGVSYIFDQSPVDIFAEIGPAIDFAPDVHGEVTGGIGIRYWF